MPKSPPTIAATSTLAMVRTAEARGFQTADLLAGVGITRAVLDDPDARLPGPAILATWDALRERTGDPLLQLVASESLPFGAYRVIDYLVEASATVGDGMERFARFFRLIAEGVVAQIDCGDGEHRLSVALAGGRALPPVYIDYVFATLVRRIRMRIRPALEVHRVELRQPEPADSVRYREVSRARVCFGAAADRLCFTDAEWNAPTENSDTTLAHLLEEHARMLAQRIPEATTGFRAEVQKAVAATLPEGASAEAVAHALHISVRTLQRRLIEMGTTFRDVVETVRAQLAQEYLSDPKVSIAEVAFLLGFSLGRGSSALVRKPLPVPMRRADDTRGVHTMVVRSAGADMLDDMGIFRTTVAVAHPARPMDRHELFAVKVDTGSEYNWIPRPLLEALGIEVERVERFETADGRILERDVGFAYLTAAGRSTATIVVFAEEGDMVLLGALGLEGLNVRVDLVKKALVPAGPVPAAGARAA